MTRKEHIAYWLNTAEKDWKAVLDLLNGGSYVQALFFTHLVLEKILKAHWVKDNKGIHPPKTHNLISLSGSIKYEFSEEEKIFLSRMNDFQIEGRYPDYTQAIYKHYKKKETEAIINEADKTRICLLKNLQ